MASLFTELVKFALIGCMCIAGGTCKSETCKDILSSDATAPSGLYTISGPSSESTIKVYCEMGLNGGGYTFIDPSSLPYITAQDLDSMFRDRRSLLLRVWKSDGSQPYAVLQQLNEYAHIPLKLALSNHAGYASPVNLQMGNPYLYAAFLPASIASTVSATNGFTVNGFRNAFRQCDRNPNSHITMFPNFREVDYSRYRVSAPICNNLISRLASNPSGRVMQRDYFMFAEMHFGGCGCYDDTKRLPSVMGFAIGFR